MKSPSGYKAGELFMNSIIDEQGNETFEYKDKFGNLILSKTGTAATYYVYDTYNLLRFVIPPKAAALFANMSAGTIGNSASTTIKELCFYYEYDGRKRQITKMIPGAETVYMIYDKLDRIVLVQNGELRLQKKWLLTKYDVYGRAVITAKYFDASIITLSAMQAFIDGSPQFHEDRSTSEEYGYTIDQAKPYLDDNNSEILTINFYDDYSFIPTQSSFNYRAPNPEFEKFSLNIKGMATGSKTKILHNSNNPDKSWITSAIYYDNFGRVIQTVSDNLLNGYDRMSNRYNYGGELLETIQEHDVESQQKISINTEFVYDRESRLISKQEKIEKGSTIIDQCTVVELEYDEIGKNNMQHLHKTHSGNYLQDISYDYNIRNWLTNISSDYFELQLDYETGSNPIYNGNISAATWSSETWTNDKKYTYMYDNLNRLTAANYSDLQGRNFSMIAVYDLNGNITSLGRKGKKRKLMVLTVLSIYFTINILIVEKAIN